MQITFKKVKKNDIKRGKKVNFPSRGRSLLKCFFATLIDFEKYFKSFEISKLFHYFKQTTITSHKNQ